MRSRARQNLAKSRKVSKNYKHENHCPTHRHTALFYNIARRLVIYTFTSTYIIVGRITLRISAKLPSSLAREMQKKGPNIISSSSSDKAPQKTTMEGIIWHFNIKIQKAISAHGAGLPKDVVANCHGVLLMSVVEVGAVFSGSIGSGILIRKNPIFGMKWSPPCACRLHGAGFGLAIGGAHKGFLIFFCSIMILFQPLHPDRNFRLGLKILTSRVIWAIRKPLTLIT